MKFKLLLFLTLFSLLPFAKAKAFDYCDQSKMGGVPLPFDQAGNFMKNCVPEYLYSWQNHNNFINAKSTPDGKGLLANGFLYLFRTPVGTVGYGMGVVEIKVKPNVKWKFVSDQYYCGGEPEEKNTIWVHYSRDWGDPVHWSEYIICSHQVIESWSFGTPEIKEKMKLEYEFVKQAKKDITKYDWFVSPHNSLFRCKECWLGYYPWDTNKVGWLDQGMDARFKVVDDLIKQKAGGIFAATEAAVQDHLDYKRPTYFLPPNIDLDSKISTVSGTLKNSIIGGVTAAASAFCDGKKKCIYKVSPKFIRDPAPGLKKSFRIAWTCGKEKDIKEVFLPADATNQIIPVKCDSKETIKIKEATYGENLLEGMVSNMTPILSNKCLNLNPCKAEIPFSGPLEASSSFWMEIKYVCENAPKKTISSRVEIDDGAFKVNFYCRK